MLLLLLPVLVQSYSLGSSLPARTRAARCASVRLAEGQSDYMLQELNPAKAGILCAAITTTAITTTAITTITTTAITTTAVTTATLTAATISYARDPVRYSRG